MKERMNKLPGAISSCFYSARTVCVRVPGGRGALKEILSSLPGDQKYPVMHCN